MNNKQPVFTQKMKDAGQYPPVGSLFFCEMPNNGGDVFKCLHNHLVGEYIRINGDIALFATSNSHPLGSKEHAEWIESCFANELRKQWDGQPKTAEKDMVCFCDGEPFEICGKPDANGMVDVVDYEENKCRVNLVYSEAPRDELFKAWREKLKNRDKQKEPAKSALTITPSNSGVALSINGASVKVLGNAGEAVMALHHLLKDESEAKRIAGLCNALSFDTSTVDLTKLLGR